MILSHKQILGLSILISVPLTAAQPVSQNASFYNEQNSPNPFTFDAASINAKNFAKVNQLKTDLENFLRRVNEGYDEQLATFKENLSDKYVFEPISVKDTLLDNLKEDAFTVIDIAERGDFHDLKQRATEFYANVPKVYNAIDTIDDNMQEYINALLKEDKAKQQVSKQLITEGIKRLQNFTQQFNQIVNKHRFSGDVNKQPPAKIAIILFASHVAQITKKAADTTTTILDMISKKTSTWEKTKQGFNKAKEKIKGLFNQ